MPLGPHTDPCRDRRDDCILSAIPSRPRRQCLSCLCLCLSLPRPHTHTRRLLCSLKTGRAPKTYSSPEAPSDSLLAQRQDVVLLNLAVPHFSRPPFVHPFLSFSLRGLFTLHCPVLYATRATSPAINATLSVPMLADALTPIADDYRIISTVRTHYLIVTPGRYDTSYMRSL